MNFFQPSFKLAAKHREGARVSKRYYLPQTPCERLLQAEIPEVAKIHLRSVAATLDPLSLLEEIRAVQAYLIALADGAAPPSTMPEAPDLAGFIAGLSSAWRAGEIRPTFSMDAKPRYLRSLRSLRIVTHRAPVVAAPPGPVALSSPPATAKMIARPQVIYAPKGTASNRALRKVWPLVCRRLEEFPNINSAQLFEELCVQFPGQFTPPQCRSLNRRIKRWRQHARARGVVIEPLKQRRLTDKPRGRRRNLFQEHWQEMLQCLEAEPDQTALELLVEFQARYPGHYHMRNLSALQRRVRAWRRGAAQRLVCDMSPLVFRPTSAA